jgi:hypothetical protein
MSDMVADVPAFEDRESRERRESFGRPLSGDAVIRRRHLWNFADLQKMRL